MLLHYFVAFIKTWSIPDTFHIPAADVIVEKQTSFRDYVY